MKGFTGKGDRFVVFKEAGRWNWNLIITNSPSFHPAAKSGHSYATKTAAIKAIESARRAARQAPELPIIED